MIFEFMILIVLKGDRLDNREQGCLAQCQDRYLDVRQQVQEALQKREGDAI